MLASMGDVALARAVSRLFGWIYFLAWSLSFYPQPLHNLRRRTTTGSTPDFPTANILGFTALTLSNGLLLLCPTIRRQYGLRHPSAPEPTIRVNDFAFAVHGMVLCAITWSQYVVPSWWGFRRVEGREGRVSWPIRGICGVGLGLVGVGIIWAAFGNSGPSPDPDSMATALQHWHWQWLDVVYLVGTLKLVLTLVKYPPQLLLNHRKRSTAGWPINTVFLDFMGGVLSLAQLGIDSALSGDWMSGVMGNPVKLFLANSSLVYDVGFMVQHFWLYGDKGSGDGGGSGEVEEGEGGGGERSALLDGDGHR